MSTAFEQGWVFNVPHLLQFFPTLICSKDRHNYTCHFLQQVKCIYERTQTGIYQARIQKFFPGGVQPWRITVEVHTYEKQLFFSFPVISAILSFANSRGGPDPPDPPSRSAHVYHMNMPIISWFSNLFLIKSVSKIYLKFANNCCQLQMELRCISEYM